MPNIKKSIFLTGATGFIGSHLAKKLGKFELVCLAPSSEIGIKALPQKAKIEFGDLANHQKINSLILKYRPNIIIHLGAITPVRTSFERPEVYQEVNFLATINLVQAALRLENLEKFIMASTMEVYGWQKEKKPFKESLPLNPASPYAVSKLAAETYVKMAGKAFGLPHIIMRACNTYGRKDETGFIVEYLVTSMLKGGSPYIGSPQAIRDFMHAEDHVNAYLKAINFDIGSREQQRKNLAKDINFYVFNFGWGSELTIMEVAQKIKKITGFKGKIKKGFPPDYPWRPVVESYLSLDATKAREVLKWKPKIPLTQGLEKTIKYWKQKIG